MKLVALGIVALPLVCGGLARAAICNTAVSSDPIVCYETASYPHVVIQTSVSAGTWEFIASDPKQIPGTSNPTIDPMMWILDASGNILAIDDDGGPGLLPVVTRSFSATTSIVILIAGALDDRQGTIDLTVQRVGTVGNTYNDLWFGGWIRYGIDARAGDRMFVGFPEGGAVGGSPANDLIVLSTSTTSCSSGCGTYKFATWPVGSYSQLTISNSSSDSAVLVGSWFQGSFIGTRWVHSRLGAGWGNSQPYQDSDCDGLTYEVEALASSTHANLDIRTCDTISGPSADCSSGLSFSTRGQSLPGTPTYGSFVPWHPRDTDNDGLRDDWELYGVKKKCSQVPAEPFYNPGACEDDTYRYTRRDNVVCGVTPPSAYTTSNALSSLEVRPRDYTVFVEAAIPSPSTLAGSTALDLASRIFSEEGLECPETTSTDLSTDCPGTLPDYVDFRVFETSTGVPTGEIRSGNARIWHVYGNFNKHFTPNRKHTGTFFYANLLTTAVTGGEGFGRALIARFGTSSSDGNVLAHELGHILDLRHVATNLAGPAQWVANYPSIMNYMYGGNYAVSSANS